MNTLKNILNILYMTIIVLGIILLGIIISYVIGYGVGYVIQLIVGQIIIYNLTLPQIFGIIFVIIGFFRK